MEIRSFGEPDFEPAVLVTYDEFEDEGTHGEADPIEQVDDGFEPAALTTFDELD